MPLDPDFVKDCFYDAEGMLIDAIVEIDAANDRVVARMPTSDALPLTRTQKTHPVRHPRHVSGGLMVHMTGIIAYVHAYYVLGLRHSEGWVGYGAKIHGARFRALAPPGDPLFLECKATRMRKGSASVFARYAFSFTQNGKVIYEGDQSALWTKIDESGAPINIE